MGGDTMTDEVSFSSHSITFPQGLDKHLISRFSIMHRISSDFLNPLNVLHGDGTMKIKDTGD
jgi:hypothetical protein